MTRGSRHKAEDRTIVYEGLGFGEAPRWRSGHLWVSDIACNRVQCIGLDGRVEKVCDVPEPNGLGWLPEGDLLVVAMSQRAVLRFTGGSVARYADLSNVMPARASDMTVDAQGRAYVSNIGYELVGNPGAERRAEGARTTGIVLVRPDGTFDMQAGELDRPNGLAITADGSTLVVAQGRLGRLSSFTIGPAGELTGQREFAELSSGSWADGICLDAEGAVWVADPLSQRCVRILEGGVVTDVVDTSPLQAIACVLGGPDRRTLFIVTGMIGSFELEALASERAGRVEAVEVRVPGAGWP